MKVTFTNNNVKSVRLSPHTHLRCNERFFFISDKRQHERDRKTLPGRPQKSHPSLCHNCDCDTFICQLVSSGNGSITYIVSGPRLTSIPHATAAAAIVLNEDTMVPVSLSCSLFTYSYKRRTLAVTLKNSAELVEELLSPCLEDVLR